MKGKAVTYILFLIFFVFALDYGLGKVYNYFYFTERSKRQDRLIHSAIGTTEEVLIFGSSRAYHHYNPEVIEEVLGLSCFNVGYGGQNIYYHLALLKAAVEREKPKIAILDIMSIDFEVTDSRNNKEKLGVLLPFVDESFVYQEAIMLRGETEKIKLISSIYPFNSKQLYLFRNNLSSQRSDTKGFVGLTAEWKKPLEEKRTIIYQPDNEKFSALDEFVDICKKNDIKLFLFISPYYINYIGKTNYSYFIENIYEKYGLEVNSQINSEKYLSSPQLFSDPVHLNKVGADIYTKEISLMIKNSL